MSPLPDSNQRLKLPIPVTPDRERPELYGAASCIDCAEETPRRLPDIYPHICSRCLFPPADVSDGDAERHRNDPRSWTEQLRDLHLAAHKNRAPFFKPFGHDLHGGGITSRGDW
jgi:hypothetical protein